MMPHQFSPLVMLVMLVMRVRKVKGFVYSVLSILFGMAPIHTRHSAQLGVTSSPNLEKRNIHRFSEPLLLQRDVVYSLRFSFTYPVPDFLL